MTEKKNKDGVPRRVGQKYKCLPSNVEVVGFYRDFIVVVDDSGKAGTMYSNHLKKLLFDPIWKDMSHHVIVTDEQRGKYKKPDCAEPYSSRKERWLDEENDKYIRLEWEEMKVWRVPADFTAWEPVDQKCEDCGSPVGVTPGLIDPVLCMDCGLKREQPEFRLFKLDWISEAWPRACGVSFDVGELIEDYRMIGYTDDPDCVDTNEIINDVYPKQPSDHTGNRKYAIGRLESQQ